MDITEFLLARIAEDEAAVRAFVDALGNAKRWRATEMGGEVHQVEPRAFGLSSLLTTFGTHYEAEHVARHDPARVLAECEAKRAMLGLFVPEDLESDDRGAYFYAEGVHEALRALSTAYASHPDYQQEWRLPA